MNFLHTRIPVGILLIGIAVSSAATALVVKSHVKVIERVTAAGSGSVKMIRNKEYKLIQPIVLVDVASESQELASLKGSLQSFLDDQKQKGIISSASVHIRDYKTGHWIGINQDERYSPGSIMKLFTLQCILKQAEREPGFLNKKITLKQHLTEGLNQTLGSNPIVPGQSYTVLQLLEFMIVNSDNDATALLNSRIQPETLNAFFSTLDLPVPGRNDWDYRCSTDDVSRLMRVLFNSSFLKPESSEFALSLLTRTNYTDGIVHDLPPSILVAHKFGERFSADTQELHETAILYLHDRPVLLTVMTRGQDRTKLPMVLRAVGAQVVNYFQAAPMVAAAGN
jgi:beta-lactamase class A